MSTDNKIKKKLKKVLNITGDKFSTYNYRFENNISNNVISWDYLQIVSTQIRDNAIKEFLM
jgi:hypothetical protein